LIVKKDLLVFSSYLEKYKIIVALIVILLLIASTYTAFLFPLYPDEIAQRIWLSRLPYDFPYLSSNLPGCTATFLQKRTISSFLPGIIDWLIHGNLNFPYQFRVIGLVFITILITLPIIFTLYCIKKKINEIKLNYVNILILIAFTGGTFFIGVNPIFLIINRGEQIILGSLLLIISIYIYCIELNKPLSKSKKIIIITSLFICISMSLHGHGKAFYLIPFYIFVFYEVIKKLELKNKIHILIIGIGLFILYEFYSMYKYAYTCQEIPEFQALIKKSTIDPFLILVNLNEFYKEYLKSISFFYRNILSITFNEISEVNYLPNVKLDLKAKISNITIWIWITLTIVVTPIFILLNILKEKLEKNNINICLLILFICTINSGLMNLTKNWYDGPYIYTIFTLIGLLSIGHNYPEFYVKKNKTQLYLIFILIIFSLSQFVFIERNLNNFKKNFSGLGPAIRKFDIRKYEQDMSKLSLKCEIKKNESSKLILDDFTYLYFKKSSLPISFTYLFGGKDFDLKNYLAKSNSDGLILMCSNIINKINNDLIIQEGTYCCISKQNMKLIN
jgi:hypothetical protein